MDIKNTITVDIDEQELRMLLTTEAKRRVEDTLNIYAEGGAVEKTDSGYRISLYHETEA